tara:strand:- start:1060 stop:3372 length:2313 start_codon:yes stop_codon:yes gene_type:complete
MKLVDGIVNENGTSFVGKDGFFWWVGEVEDNEDPMELGRVKVRVLGYYTSFDGGTTSDLPTTGLPWATVLQHTSQAGNNGQGESSGQLQPGAIVLGFFLDGEMAQMPMVLGVMRVNKSEITKNQSSFAFTDQDIVPGTSINNSAVHPAERNTINPTAPLRQSDNNSVAIPGNKLSNIGGSGSPKNVGLGILGGTTNPIKPSTPTKLIPAAHGVGGPWKTLEYKLSYLIEDLANTSANLVKIDKDTYLDIVIGSYIKKSDLTKKIDDYLNVIFTQVISAMRQSLANLATNLKVDNILKNSSGLPFAAYNVIQPEVTKILTSLCALDANIATYKAAPMSTINTYLDSFLAGVDDKPTLVKKTVNTVVADIVKDSAKIITGVGDIAKSVKTTVSGIGEATKIIDEWEKGSGIYELNTNLFETVNTNLTGLMKLLTKFTSSNCNRSSATTSSVGWYPLYGITTTVKDVYGTMFDQADPYLTSSKNHINGSYELYLGTPGRQGEVHKKSNGTTHTSIAFNDAHYYEKKIRDDLRSQIPEEEYAAISSDVIEAKVKEYVDKNTNNKGDIGGLIADHVSYAGALTQEVHGDDCKLVNGSYVRTIDGDYHLKITGNCHIEVGGGFFLSAEGAGSTTPQKNTIKFGSDTDMNVVGAKFELQGAECNVASISTKITGHLFENSSYQQTMSAVELSLTADNSIEMVTPHLLQLINIEENATPKKLTGIRTIVSGGWDTQINPSDVKGYRISLTSTRSSYNLPVTDNLFTVTVADAVRLTTA